MATIHEIRLRLDEFVGNLDRNIQEAVVTVEHLLLDLQREQMKKRQVTSNDSPIMPEYSSKWKAIKGLVYPNLYNTGAFQNNLVLTANKEKYLIKSTDWKNEKLVKKYGEEIFGVAPSNQPEAKKLTTIAISERLKKDVFK